MKLFVDDIRPAPEGWHLARTITEAIRLLAHQHDSITEVSLDHDIVYVNSEGLYTGEASKENYTSVAFFIASMPEELRPQTVCIHTANPIGAQNLTSILKGKVVTIIRDSTYSHEWLNSKSLVQEGHSG